MTPVLRAVSPGPYVTIQDAGRPGWHRFGVSGCGAMDMPSLIAANALVGNPPDAPALEFAHVGGSWEILAQSVRIAVTGGSFGVTADGVAVQPWRSHRLQRGQVLHIKGASDAVWGYLAVAHGFDLAPQLGSCATHLRSGLGVGRFVEGDTLPLRVASVPIARERQLVPHASTADPIRVVMGPQDGYFSQQEIAAFLASTYRMTHRSDRMGAWLDGPVVAHCGGFNVISDGLVPGCIQIPGSGKPVVLLMDCQTIGGYPKLATIVSADLPRFAQCRPGSPVKFAAIDIDAAQLLYRGYRAALAQIPQTVREIPERTALPFWLRAS
jgi:biotin-dependent carboxylase-like uncharacterized protein